MEYANGDTGRKDEMVLFVTDTFFASEQTVKIAENLITPFKPEVIQDNNGLRVMIVGERGVCTITSNTFGHCPRQIQILPKEHLLHDGTKTTVYLIQWELPVKP